MTAPAVPSASAPAKPFPEHLREYMEEFRAWVRGSKTPDEAAKMCRKFRLSEEECETLKKEYYRENRTFVELTDPRVLRENPRIETWYAGPDFEGAWCWPPFRRPIEGKWLKDDFRKLNDASTKILAHLPHPTQPRYAHRGLVVGYVQSGKTANYSALIAKAADVGYRFFIVLSGTTSSLRRQTQERLEKDICQHHPQFWQLLTHTDRDFSAPPGHPDSVLTEAHPRYRILCVVKKNKHILNRLAEFLERASPAARAGCPTIIIDDEADNASVNTASKDQRTAINNGIIRVLTSLPKAAYVGYTATPFANIFINPKSPKDLFPRHFIVELSRPQAYFGTEKIFGRSVLWYEPAGKDVDGLDIVRYVSVKDPDEQVLLRPAKAAEREDFEPELPVSLWNALRYFLLATACRYARGDSGEHSTMLVHTSQYVSMHGKTAALLTDCLNRFKSTWKSPKEKASLKELWDSESGHVTVATRTLTTDFAEVIAKLPEVLGRCEVIVDNGQPNAGSRLVYDATPRAYIAIGGNTLSRGLTLEGLVVSYFIRTASAYDTLLQMGRWFGYRPRYEDLPRIWMTAELEDYFFFLAGVEEEIRRDIQRLEKEGKSPQELAIRVRTHPKLLITAKNKMQNAQLATASYSDRRVQSFLFNHSDASWLERNRKAAEALVTGLLSRGLKPEARGGRVGLRGARPDEVKTFLRTYRFHEDHDELRDDLLIHYIDQETSAGSLTSWNVFVMGQKSMDKRLGTMTLGPGLSVNCINRSRFRATEPCNIKSLTSQPDRIVDLGISDKNLDEKALVDKRNELAPGVGLLLLYPISKRSTPESGTEKYCETCKLTHAIPEDRKVGARHPLEAVEDVVGAALVFPKSVKPEDEYMAADLGDLLLAEPEEAGSEENGELSPEELEG